MENPYLEEADRIVLVLEKAMNRMPWLAMIGQSEKTASLNFLSNRAELSGWHEALEALEKPYWNQTKQDAAQSLIASVTEKGIDDMEFQSVLVFSQNHADQLFQKYLRVKIPEFALELVQKAIIFDVSWYAVEKSFVSLEVTKFFEPNMYWYLFGQFPCGYDGVYPTGKCIVY
jgi:hypothetical protein